MDQVTKVRKHLKREQWKNLIKDCQSSGMTVSVWCKMNDICEQTYYRNLRKLREDFQIILLYIETLSCAYAEYLKRHLNVESGRFKSLKNKTNYKIEVGDYYAMVKNALPIFFQKYQVDMLGVATEIVEYICAEAFADMMAILTLELAPEEYIESFVYDICVCYEYGLWEYEKGYFYDESFYLYNRTNGIAGMFINIL